MLLNAKKTIDIYTNSTSISKSAVALLEEHCCYSRWNIVLHDVRKMREYDLAKLRGLSEIPSLIVDGTLVHSGGLNVEDLIRIGLNDWAPLAS